MSINEHRDQHEAWFDNGIRHNKRMIERKDESGIVRYMVVYQVGDRHVLEWAHSREEAKELVKPNTVAVYDLGFDKELQLNLKGVWNL